MSIVKRHLAEHEERLVLIEEICIDKGALVLEVRASCCFDVINSLSSGFINSTRVSTTAI